MSKGKLKPKKVKGRVQLLRAVPYKDNMVYIRMVDNEIFMYDVVFKNQIYSSNLIIKPKVGEAKLSQYEINQAASLIWAGAVATLEMLLETHDVVAEKKATTKRMLNSN